MKRLLVIMLLLSRICSTLLATPPKPPVGKRWILNPDFSDEFNGTKIDEGKWYNYHPTWKGRVPGLFLPSQVSVKDGYLQIKGEKMKKDTTIHAYGKDLTFNIAGGAVVSKKSVFLGYYECRAKAAATTMSTTFWFSGKGGIGPNKTDSYGLEWDIHESIGRNGDFEGSYFANGMHSNAHYWYTDTLREKHDYRATQVSFENEEVSSKEFHIYGGWWRDETTASYYYDNGEPKHQKFYDVINKKPFDKPMFMRLVSETYPFPWIKLPNDEELADDTKNTVYYDWVRGYSLVDIAENNHSSYESKVNIYKETITFENAKSTQTASKIIKIPFTYKANKDRSIDLKLCAPDGELIKEISFVIYAGYGNIDCNFQLENELNPSTGYTIEGIMKPIGASKKDNLYKNLTVVDII